MTKSGDLGSELQAMLRDLKRGGTAAGLVGLFVNVLHLGLPLFTIQVYDRVLSSGSTETLTALVVLVAILLVFQTLLDIMRQHVFVILGSRALARLGEPVFRAAIEASLTKGPHRSSTAMQDVSELRGFLASGAVAMPLDLAFTPLFLFVLFMLNPVYGLVGLFGAISLLLVALLAEVTLRGPTKAGQRALQKVNADSREAIRHSEVITAMGMLPDLARRWRVAQSEAVAMMERGAGMARLFAVLSRTWRSTLQVGVIASGAVLVIGGHASAGTIIAATVLTGRLFLPFEQAAGSWKQWVDARAVIERLKEISTSGDALRSETPVTIESGKLIAERLSFFGSKGGRPVLQNINFELESGMMMGIIGSSGAGKSTLANIIVGISPPSAGGVYLDGSRTYAHERSSFGQAVGYLPQEPGLLTGTVAENIGRFGAEDMARVVRAARLAGVHDMIGKMPKGYATQLGPAGYRLSGGQKQRVALARALYGDPKLIVLDEPNSNLDAEGEGALISVIEQARANGTTVVVVAQRMSILNRADRLLYLGEGAVLKFGTHQEVMDALGPRKLSAATPKPPRIGVRQ